jgi:flagellar biosynthesis component FlhA
MSLIVIILLVVALVLFVIATIGVPSPPRFNLLAAGLAFCVLAMLAGHVKAQTPQQQAWKEQQAYERDQRSRGNDYELRNQKDYDAIEHKRRGWEHKQWCREWRARVDRHPRLILPRSCWR